MKKLLYLGFVLLALFSCSENVAIEQNVENQLVRQITITAKPIEFFDLEGSAVTRGYLTKNGNIYPYFFVTGDAFGLFPSVGYQIAFNVNTPEPVSATSVVAEGWRTKPGETYACYFPFVYENKDSHALPFSYVGQEEDVNAPNLYDHLNDYVLLLSKPVSDANNTGVFNFDVYDNGVTMDITFAAPSNATFTKMILYAPNTSFTLTGSVNLFASNDANAITPDATSTVLSLGFKNLSASQSSMVHAYVRCAPVNLSGQTLYLRLYDDNNNVYEQSKTLPVNAALNLSSGKGVGLSFDGTWSEPSSATQNVSVSSIENISSVLAGASEMGSSSINIEVSDQNPEIEAITIPSSLSTAKGNKIDITFDNTIAAPNSDNLITITDNTRANANGGTSQSNVVLNFAPTQATEVIPSLTVSLPYSTVNLNAISGTTKFNVVNSTTAYNTLVVNSGVTIDTLHIYGGNIVIQDGATVNNIYDHTGGKSSIVNWNEGGTTEGEVNAEIPGFQSGN